MLSRHADNLFWLARYVERAENTARIIDTAGRIVTMPVGDGRENSEWQLAIVASGSVDGFLARHSQANAQNVVDFLTFDPENPSSIHSCITIARTNARAVRTALTMDMWQTINSAWLELRRQRTGNLSRQELADFLSWVIEVSLRFDGSSSRTMLRNDAYYFEQLGTFLERADATARILAAKAHFLKAGCEIRSGSLEYYQWSSILRAVSALTSYHWVYRRNLSPDLVADLLICREEMPRSLISCHRIIGRMLDHLSEDYGRQGPAQRTARDILNRLENTDVDQVFATGVAEFLDEFIKDNERLGLAISEQYLV